MKKYIIAFVLGAIIFSGISGVTAYTIMANSIEFQSRNNNWNVNNVGDALNSLYTMKTSEDYSTDEKRVGTWIDDKPLYQKTFSFTTSSGWSTINNTIDNIEEICNVFGSVGSKTNKYSTGSVGDGYEKLIFYADTQYIKAFTSGDNLINKTAYVTLQYTKTTDTANN